MLVASCSRSYLWLSGTALSKYLGPRAFTTEEEPDDPVTGYRASSKPEISWVDLGAKKKRKKHRASHRTSSRTADFIQSVPTGLFQIQIPGLHPQTPKKTTATRNQSAAQRIRATQQRTTFPSSKRGPKDQESPRKPTGPLPSPTYIHSHYLTYLFRHPVFPHPSPPYPYPYSRTCCRRCFVHHPLRQALPSPTASLPIALRRSPFVLFAFPDRLLHRCTCGCSSKFTGQEDVYYPMGGAPVSVSLGPSPSCRSSPSASPGSAPSSSPP
ncbi:hypothetical protein QBC35DRAFT_267185 [Podospora australis]|uniref:Uncharacterized protein n=1 Tax=Podospora australis TaxID=1536484 RepID=A0AAN6WSD0_9PEZI|nr:hypothetical protein QBC35DRAFT_267185 [Podospora australis]